MMKKVIIILFGYLICTSSAYAEIPLLNNVKKVKVNKVNPLQHAAPFHKIVFTHSLSIGNTQSQIACLAANIYFEARSENADGRLAVAHVTMNRANSIHYPNDVCDVVTQPRQFSWYNGGEEKVIREKEAWEDALSLARVVYTSSIADPTSGALYYHRVDISPQWSNSLAYIDTIGAHKFYY